MKNKKKKKRREDILNPGDLKLPKFSALQYMKKNVITAPETYPPRERRYF